MAKLKISTLFFLSTVSYSLISMQHLITNSRNAIIKGSNISAHRLLPATMLSTLKIKPFHSRLIYTASKSIISNQNNALLKSSTNLLTIKKQNSLRHLLQKRQLMTGFEAVACTAAGTAINGGFGYVADEFFDTLPLFTTVFAILGLGIGGLYCYTETESFQKDVLKSKMAVSKNERQKMAQKQGDDLIKEINSHYINHSMPLACAFKELSADSDCLYQARAMAESLYKETQKLEYQEMSAQLNEPIENLRKALETIKTQLQFREQMDSFHKEQTANETKRVADAARTNATANTVNAIANLTK